MSWVFHFFLDARRILVLCESSLSIGTAREQLFFTRRFGLLLLLSFLPFEDELSSVAALELSDVLGSAPLSSLVGRPSLQDVRGLDQDFLPLLLSASSVSSATPTLFGHFVLS